jgi:hypothetical protein
MSVSRQHLSQLLQSWNFGDQFQQPCLGFCIEREFDLLSEFWGEARSRESRQHESHGIVNQWTPSHINLGNQGFCRHKLQNPFRWPWRAVRTASIALVLSAVLMPGERSGNNSCAGEVFWTGSSI